MAIYIQLVKLSDGLDQAVYEFGPGEGIIGRVSIHKATGDVTLLEIAPAAADRENFYLPRVARVLIRCLDEGAFPDRTCYAA